MKSSLIIILLFFLIQNSAFSQYTLKDSELVHTTFTKEFNKSIIDRYLFSKDEMEVKAALLTIAQSEDTNWVNEVIKINFSKFGKYVCFTLGELGSCLQSGKFLLSKIKQENNPLDYLPSEYEALGKTGNKDIYEYLVNSYFKNSWEKFNGISLAVYNFFIRNIGNKETAHAILSNEIGKSRFPGRRNFEAVFALYRIGPNEKMNNLLIEKLHDYMNLKTKVKNQNKYARETLPYILGCLRRNKHFPDDKMLFTSLLKSNDFLIKVEAAQTLCYFPFNNSAGLNEYLELLNNSNTNIARAAAASVKNLDLNKVLNENLKKLLQEKINKGNLPTNVEGELFLSFLELFPLDFNSAVENYEKIIPKEYFYQACSNFKSSKGVIDYLYNNFLKENLKNKNIILQSVLNFQPEFKNDPKIKSIIIKSIESGAPSLISIAADGIDSTYTSLLKDKLVPVIKSQVKKYKSNPDFLESIMSLSNLSKKIDNKFYNEILNKISNSEIYSIKKFAFKKLGLDVKGLRKDDNLFHYFWKNAFKYKYAIIVTSKGKFKIEFLPQYAPVSVGNFCYLAEQKFFNDNIFHRVVPGFVIQGGDPKETGWGGPGYDIVSEFSPLNYNTGMVGMASAGKDTEGSQWFVTTGTYPHLNGRYTIFAKTISGINTVYRVDQGEKILKIILP